MRRTRLSLRRAAVISAATGALFVTVLAGSAGGAPGDVTATRVADINPAGGSSQPDSLTNVNGTLYFRADDGANGFELWKTDGTTATMVEDAIPGGGINPNPGDGSNPQNLTNVNGTLFFTADDGTNGEELWTVVGTTATMVEDAVPGGGINPNPGVGSNLQNLTNVDGTLFFSADDGTNGSELWTVTGGTATMVEDAVPGGGIAAGPANSNPSQLTDVNGTLFFGADDGTPNGYELWTLVGTTATMVEDAVPGGGINPGFFAGSNPFALTDVNGTLFFSADDGTNGRELWTVTGGTATLVEDAVPGGGISPGATGSFPSRLTAVDGTLFFTADDGTNGEELWSSDGTSATMVEDAVPGGGINPNPGVGSNLQNLTNVDGTVFFSADDGTNGIELWKSDETTATLVEDAVPGGGINPGGGDSDPIFPTNAGGTLFLSANDGTNGQELWKVAPPFTTATMIEDAVPGGGIAPGNSGSFPFFLTDVNGTLFFQANDDTNGIELWKSDGNTATMAEDSIPGGGIGPGATSSSPQKLTNVNGTLFFAAQDGTTGVELWKATVEGPAPPLTPITPITPVTPTTPTATAPAKKKCKKGQKLKKGKCVKKKKRKKRRG